MVQSGGNRYGGHPVRPSSGPSSPRKYDDIAVNRAMEVEMRNVEESKEVGVGVVVVIVVGGGLGPGLEGY